MIVFSVLLAAGVALVVSLRAEAPAIEGARAAETSTQENEFDPGKKLEIDDEPGEEPGREGLNPRSESTPRGEEPAPRKEKLASSKQKPASSEEKSAPRREGLEALPVSSADWPLPTNAELSRIGEPRYFDPDPDAVMTLTIEALGLYDVPVIDSSSEDALERGVMHVPDTAYPWDSADQKNVFLAGHRVGLPGADSRLLFFDLDELSSGDSIILEDRNGNTYKYRVTELFKVKPSDTWVADTLVGRDLLTLQTCTYPTFEDRLIVRADHA
jgi:sortase A